MKAKIKRVLLWLVAWCGKSGVLKSVLKALVLRIPPLKKFYIRLIGTPAVNVVENVHDLSEEARWYYFKLKQK